MVGADFFPLDVTDFGATIKKIQAAKPDMVISVLVGGAHVSFYRQWAAAGMKQAIPMASTTFGAGNENRLLTPEEADGIIVSYAYFQELRHARPTRRFWSASRRASATRRPISAPSSRCDLCGLHTLGRVPSPRPGRSTG